MSDRTDAFAGLKHAHAQGVLTDAEYEQKKAALMRDDAGRSDAFETAMALREGMRSSRWLWLGLTFAVVLAIGGTFLWKGYYLARERGEIAGAEGGTAPAAGVIPAAMGNLCLLAPFMNAESLNQRVSVLAEKATEAGRAVNWEDAPGGGILRISWSDQLAREDHEMSVELIRTDNARPLADCRGAKDGAVATRINMDGQVLTGLAVGMLLQQALPPAASKDNSPSQDQGDMNVSEPVSDQGAIAGVVESRGDESFSAEQKRLIREDVDLEERCRGSSEDTTACDLREVSSDRLVAAGVCYGREGQANAEYDYHLCRAGSHGSDKSPEAVSSPTVNAM